MRVEFEGELAKLFARLHDEMIDEVKFARQHKIDIDIHADYVMDAYVDLFYEVESSMK